MNAFPIAPDKPWLAPMAGFSDLPFRLLCRKYGRRQTFSKTDLNGSPDNATGVVPR